MRVCPLLPCACNISCSTISCPRRSTVFTNSPESGALGCSISVKYFKPESPEKDFCYAFFHKQMMGRASCFEVPTTHVGAEPVRFWHLLLYLDHSLRPHKLCIGSSGFRNKTFMA